jgi:hypothetical protein
MTELSNKHIDNIIEERNTLTNNAYKASMKKSKKVKRKRKAKVKKSITKN